MFLSSLESKNKERFLKLCVYAALSNGVFAEEEKGMISTYCREMDIPENIPDTNDPLDIVLSDIADNTSNMEKNIIVLEILGLVKADGVYDDKEKSFIEKVVKGIKVKKEVIYKLNSLLKIYTTVCEELYATILE